MRIHTGGSVGRGPAGARHGHHHVNAISLPTHQTDMTAMGHHHITMVTGEGKELQQVAIVTSEGIMTGGSQGSGPHYQQVALLATANGTQIAVQLEEQQTLEEAISMATAAIQQGGLVQDKDTSEGGC
ncbi:unnamed protein product [Coregonus sp. 'balchen']|nr:unnamed protein product [Coregonus sp. 'balchen']